MEKLADYIYNIAVVLDRLPKIIALPELTKILTLVQ